MVQEEILFKGISYLELWKPFYKAERNHLCKFGREYQEEQFCENILNLGLWFRRFRFKDFLSGALETLLFSGGERFKLEENSRTKLFCSAILFQLQNLENKV